MTGRIECGVAKLSAECGVADLSAECRVRNAELISSSECRVRDAVRHDPVVFLIHVGVG